MLRFLDRSAHITTRYGGGFVQSIDGLAGAESGGRRFDWFFYVNGIESPVGSTQVPVKGGDRIWWDYRDWTSAMSVPAVVGSWPQPFAAAKGPIDDRLRRRAAPVRDGRARLERAGRHGDGRQRRRRRRRHRAFWWGRGPRCARTQPRASSRAAPRPAACSRPVRRHVETSSLLRADGTVGQRAPAGTGLVAALRRARRSADVGRHVGAPGGRRASGPAA